MVLQVRVRPETRDRLLALARDTGKDLSDVVRESVESTLRIHGFEPVESSLQILPRIDTWLRGLAHQEPPPDPREVHSHAAILRRLQRLYASPQAARARSHLSSLLRRRFLVSRGAGYSFAWGEVHRQLCDPTCDWHAKVTGRAATQAHGSDLANPERGDPAANKNAPPTGDSASRFHRRAPRAVLV